MHSSSCIWDSYSSAVGYVSFFSFLPCWDKQLCALLFSPPEMKLRACPWGWYMVHTLCLADSHIKRNFLILCNLLFLLITGTENMSEICNEYCGNSGCTVGSLLRISKVFTCLNLQLSLDTEVWGSVFISFVVSWLKHVWTSFSAITHQVL